jgi:hypothetical protein
MYSFSNSLNHLMWFIQREYIFLLKKKKKRKEKNSSQDRRFFEIEMSF